MAVTVLLSVGGRMAVAADSVSPSAEAAPKGSFFDSLKQAFTQDVNREVVRGHFEVGTPPDTHRFYCLVDLRSGRQEQYAVAGEPFIRRDGMTGLKSAAVTPDSCSLAERQGRLVTAGYIVRLSAREQPPSVAPVPPSAPASPPPTSGVGNAGDGPERLDVGGIRLGMAPAQVRDVLRARALTNFFEATGTLGSTASSGATADTRFVNEIAAWSRDDGASESYEVLFTPVPGRERVLAVVHSISFGSDSQITAVALKSALLQKFHGYADPGAIPDAATWRLQSDGAVLAGDACGRRGIVGGLAKGAPALDRSNIALKTSADEFRYQIQRCGVGMVTADLAGSVTQGPAGAVKEITVSAYSPAIALEGATAAARLIQPTGSGQRPRESPIPDL